MDKYLRTSRLANRRSSKLILFLFCQSCLQPSLLFIRKEASRPLMEGYTYGNMMTLDKSEFSQLFEFTYVAGRLYYSVMRAVEFHREAGKIQ